MTAVTATGYDDYLEEDRPAIFVSYGSGNLDGEPEVHLHIYSPEDGLDLPLGWFRRDALLAAVLHPEAVTA